MNPTVKAKKTTCFKVPRAPTKIHYMSICLPYIYLRLKSLYYECVCRAMLLFTLAFQSKMQLASRVFTWVDLFQVKILLPAMWLLFAIGSKALAVFLKIWEKLIRFYYHYLIAGIFNLVHGLTSSFHHLKWSVRPSFAMHQHKNFSTRN